MLLKIDNVLFILQNHSPEHFPFVLQPSNVRQRTTFYQILAQLLFLDESANVNFKQFVAPVQRQFQVLAEIPAHLWVTDGQQTLIGLFRDIRGILAATITKRSYMMVFDWLYPQYFPVFILAAERCYSIPSITTPLLKCLCECTNNKTQRMTFDASSPNGILLFREVSKILVAYSNGIISTQIVNNPYAERYKGISVCFQILTKVMTGNYVNFGVFELYGDKALSEALRAIINLFLAVPVDDIMVYPKLTLSTFHMFDVLFRNHIQVIVELDTTVFSRICSAFQLGLCHPKPQVVTHCAAALDHLLTFFCQQLEQDTMTSRQIANHLQNNPDLFPSFLNLIFNILMFQGVLNRWSLSRPLFVLVCLNTACFNQWKEQVLSSQSPSNKQAMQDALNGLLKDVEINIETRNRERFTQNVTVFLKNIESFM
eukprot:c17696_g1_i1.p1 GENE.c17696_g1_i1~~c17696_g1_i1.p1  ORF type:complete len:428 (-),score=142.60 c17696_g1_i1:27-1310(-)